MDNDWSSIEELMIVLCHVAVIEDLRRTVKSSMDLDTACILHKMKLNEIALTIYANRFKKIKSLKFQRSPVFRANVQLCQRKHRFSLMKS